VTQPSEACGLAVVTDAAFLPGTVVLLSSFLHHNPWFSGDIVVIQHDLPDAARRALARFPNLRFHDVGAPLLERLAAVTMAHPSLAAKAPIFYSLEAFNLPAYDRVLKLDSDMLCRANVSGLLDTDGALLCCPDQPYFRHQVRDPTTYVPRAGSQAADDILPVTFNAGMLVLSPPRLGRGIYDELLRSVTPETWRDVGTHHTDSVVLNRRFQHAWVRLPDIYNYFISKFTSRYTRRRVPVHEAAFLHFIGRPKPWQPREPDVVGSSDEYRLALTWWDEAWQRACNVTP
jgi:lipopolysaccharide biosynthesis glycosyltransferase